LDAASILTGLGGLLTGAGTVYAVYRNRQKDKTEKKSVETALVAQEKAEEYQRALSLMGEYVRLIEQMRREVDFLQQRLADDRAECERRVKELRAAYEGRIQELINELAEVTTTRPDEELRRDDER
jgi:NAD(P)-dependent dehydrogenase (short-subunit alcohol dehydrogenase family)